MVWYRTGLENVGRVHIANLSTAIDSSYSPGINSVTCQWMAPRTVDYQYEFPSDSALTDETKQSFINILTQKMLAK